MKYGLEHVLAGHVLTNNLHVLRRLALVPQAMALS